MPPLVRAGIAHLYFVSIRPFEDGNGRIGRALVEKCLSRNMGNPTLIALSSTINDKKNDYYKALEVDLVEKGIFIKTGRLKGTRYELNLTYPSQKMSM